MKWSLVIGCLVAAVAISLVVFLTLKTKGNDPIPQSIRDKVTFSIPYIVGQPAGYKINPASFNANNQVVIYGLSKAGRNNIFVSTQGKPDNFDFDDFNLKQLSGSSEFLTPLGKAVIGVYGGRTVVSIVTDKVWVIMNTDASGGVSAKDLQTIAGSFHQPS